MLQRHHHYCRQRSSLRAMNPFTLSKDGVGGRKEVRKEVNMRGVGEARRVASVHAICHVLGAAPVIFSGCMLPLKSLNAK